MEGSIGKRETNTTPPSLFTLYGFVAVAWALRVDLLMHAITSGKLGSSSEVQGLREHASTHVLRNDLKTDIIIEAPLSATHILVLVCSAAFSMA
ncbi:hypothetical protein NP233_g11656 [Leucocoprinus birnbaumii]|uniref:Uncharacterized protein n=1 Tax=Leucocoprinus birnbaumii TaxID=56174 RepID=A0AAD5VIK2_9AGAR|nr:hypothetical protein NP233_g11656 [Leucocoprinus birnbaumii]